MKCRLTAALALLAAPGSLATIAQAQDRGLPRGERVDRVPARGGMSFRANPSALISAEIALSQLARKKGQWKAMRDTAAPEAVMFGPDPVNAQEWLKRRGDKPLATKWDPQAAWMSCDGSIGVVEGAWSQGDTSGFFASVWQRQKKGGYKWLLRLDDIDRAAVTAPPDMLSAIVADCPSRRARPSGGKPQPGSKQMEQPPAPVDALTGYSADKSLYWQYGSDPSGTGQLLVRVNKGGGMQAVAGAELESNIEG